MAVLVCLWPTHFFFCPAKASVTYIFVSTIDFCHFHKCSFSSRDFPLPLALCNPNHLSLNYIAFIWDIPTKQHSCNGMYFGSVCWGELKGLSMTLCLLFLLATGCLVNGILLLFTSLQKKKLLLWMPTMHINRHCEIWQTGASDDRLSSNYSFIFYTNKDHPDLLEGRCRKYKMPFRQDFLKEYLNLLILMPNHNLLYFPLF